MSQTQDLLTERVIGTVDHAVIVRELAETEFERLRAFPPFDEVGLPDPSHTKVVIAEQDGTIVAYWVAFDTVHVEPLWIDPEHRHRISVVRGLWREMSRLLSAAQVRGAFAIISDGDVATNLPAAMKLGFARIPAMLLYMDLTEKET